MAASAKEVMPINEFVRVPQVSVKIEQLLGERASQFVTSLITAVNENVKLRECDPQSVLNSALTAASMDLPINQNLGFAYLIPYKVRNKEAREYETKCQFQMGYKGFIQLAQRSGYYRSINARDVREGEIIGEDFASGEMQFKKLSENRNKAKVVGYIAFFELLNGFRKTLYMTTEEVLAHANKYSKNYAKYKSGLWADDFDAMATKTVLKLLLSKYGPLSTQMQTAIQKDQTVDGEYSDNPRSKSAKFEDAVEDKADVIAKLETAKSTDELKKIWSSLSKNQQLYKDIQVAKDTRKEELSNENVATAAK